MLIMIAKQYSRMLIKMPFRGKVWSF